MIHDGRSRFGTSAAAFYAERGHALPAEVDADAVPAEAEVNVLGGVARWVARCPDCAGAEYVWLDSPAFYCISCRNAGIGGRARRLLIPDDRAEIEAVLLARPDPVTRNRLAGETAADLMAENIEHGVQP